MLENIKNILKIIGNGISYANAGEMLSDEEKYKILANDKEGVDLTIEKASYNKTNSSKDTC